DLPGSGMTGIELLDLHAKFLGFLHLLAFEQLLAFLDQLYDELLPGLPEMTAGGGVFRRHPPHGPRNPPGGAPPPGPPCLPGLGEQQFDQRLTAGCEACVPGVELELFHTTPERLPVVAVPQQGAELVLGFGGRGLEKLGNELIETFDDALILCPKRSLSAFLPA